MWTFGGFSALEAGQFPPHSWALFAGHAVLASALVVAIGCLLDGEEVPRGLVVFGAVCGLAWSLTYPWPTPNHGPTVGTHLRPGFVPWPVWWPLPAGLEAGSLPLGLTSALAGIVLPTALVRLVDRRRRLGSAAGILMMTGGFLGWQPLAVALASATAVALALATAVALGIGARRITGRPFAFLLTLTLIVAWLGWAWLGMIVWPVVSDAGGLAVFVGVLAAGLTVVSRLTIRGLDSRSARTVSLPKEFR